MTIWLIYWTLWYFKFLKAYSYFWYLAPLLIGWLLFIPIWWNCDGTACSASSQVFTRQTLCLWGSWKSFSSNDYLGFPYIVVTKTSTVSEKSESSNQSKGVNVLFSKRATTGKAKIVTQSIFILLVYWKSYLFACCTLPVWMSVCCHALLCL